MIIGPRYHFYVARTYSTPPAIPSGLTVIELGDLVRHITRAQDPNVPGFDPAAVIANYAIWPLHRYGPLLAARLLLRGLAVVDRLDPRKKGIVAEDIGLGFAAHAMTRLGASPMMTKWEIAQADRRTRLVEMLVSAGQPPRLATRISQLMSAGLGGADFIGYSRAMNRWIVCESKGSLGEPPDEADLRAIVANPEGPARGRNGATIATVPPYQHGLRQKRRTAAEVRGWGAGDVVGMAVFTAVGSEGNGRLTVVDYVDPEAPPELREALAASTPIVRELICEAHFAWMSSVFGLNVNLWGAADAGRRGGASENGLTRDVAVELPDGVLQFVFRLSADAARVIAEGSLGLLDAYAVEHPDAPDGLTCEVLAGPDFVEEAPDQAARDAATLSHLDLNLFGPRRPFERRRPEFEDS